MTDATPYVVVNQHGHAESRWGSLQVAEQVARAGGLSNTVLRAIYRPRGELPKK